MSEQETLNQLRPIPDYLEDCLEFEVSIPSSGSELAWYLLAKWEGEFWMCWWNKNARCWTTLRKPTTTDLNWIESLDNQGLVRHRK